MCVCLLVYLSLLCLDTNQTPCPQVFELQSQYGDLETAPLLGNPWPSSQFLSHLLSWLEEQPQTSYFAEYLNLTNLAYLVPGHDGKC